MTEPISRAWRQTPPSPSRRKFLNHLGQALSVTLLPGFASKVFGAGPEGLGWLASAMGVGAMISASLIATRGKR